MITLEDCEAFCEAEPALVEEVARHDCLAGIAALAKAHEQALCGTQVRRESVAPAPCQRLAA